MGKSIWLKLCLIPFLCGTLTQAETIKYQVETGLVDPHKGPTESKVQNGQKHGSGELRFSVETSIKEIHEIKPEVVADKFKNSPFNDQVDNMVAAAKANGIDPTYFISMIAFETAWGTSRRLKNSNLIGSPIMYDEKTSFDTPQEGIAAYAAYLKNQAEKNAHNKVSNPYSIGAMLNNSDLPKAAKNKGYDQIVLKLMRFIAK